VISTGRVALGKDSQEVFLEKGKAFDVRKKRDEI